MNKIHMICEYMYEHMICNEPCVWDIRLSGNTISASPTLKNNIRRVKNLSASLSVKSDEKEGDKITNQRMARRNADGYYSPDGKAIRKALLEKDLISCALSSSVASTSTKPSPSKTGSGMTPFI